VSLAGVIVSLAEVVVSLAGVIVSLADVVVSLSGVIFSLAKFVVFYSKVSDSVVFNRLVPFEVTLSLDSSV